ncbi:MAG: hypothetical protein AAF560_30230 [Acidobacteriota bacterium]
MSQPSVNEHGRIVAATLTVPELASAQRLWTQTLRYEVRDQGVVDGELAMAWGAPRQAGRPYALLAPASGADVFVRLVEGKVPADCEPRRSLGWAALELTVRDVDARYAELQDSELEILGEPQLLEFTDKIYPMQVATPDQVVIYLNEVRGNLPNLDLPQAQCDVDHIFIVILGAPDLDHALAFYRDTMGFETDAPFEIAYKMINSAFGLDPAQRHRLATTRVGRRVNVEIDQYPAKTPPRPTAPGMLPPATAMVSFAVDSLEAIDVPLLGRPVTRDEAPYHGRLAGTCLGPAGELIELIEWRQ